MAIKWTSDHIEFLKSKFAEGFSAEMIARMFYDQFGIVTNRNSIRGKLYSMSLKRSEMMPSPPMVQKISPTTIERLPTKQVLKIQSPPQFAPDEPEPENCCNFDQLNNKRCRWPFGSEPPFRYCGDKALEGS